MSLICIQPKTTHTCILTDVSFLLLQIPTGTFTIVTPPLITPEPSLTGTAAQIYCRLIASWFFIVVLVKVSVMTCMLLAIEQWFAIFKPQRYQTTFGRQRTKILMLFVWIISGITTISLVVSSKTINVKCVITTLFETQYVIGLLQTVFTIIFPCFIAWSAIAALLYQRNNLQIEADMTIRRHKPGNIIVVLTVTLSWFLEEFSAIVQEYAFPGVKNNVRHYARMIALFTPCLVPCICLAMFKEFRQFKSLYVSCCSTKEDENSTGNNLREDTKNRSKECDILAVSPKVKNSFNENVYQTLAPQQLSVRRDSSNDVMEAETSPSAIRYVKQGEITTIAMIW